MGAARVAAGDGRGGGVYPADPRRRAPRCPSRCSRCCMLGALAAGLQHRRSTDRWRWVLAAGVLAGLTILTRANAMVLLLPLALAVWTVRPRFSPRALAVPALLVVVAVVTVSPWTIRNAIVLDRFIPVSTQLGSALAGHLQRPGAAGRGEPRLLALDPAHPGLTGPLRRGWATSRSPTVEDDPAGALEGVHPRSPDVRGDGRAVDHAAHVRARRPDWSRHTASTISVDTGLGQRRGGVLLGLRAAGARRRVHPPGEADAVLRLAVPDPALPERGLPRRRDAALPDRHRPVHRHAGGTGATTRTSSVRGPCTPSTRSSSISDVAEGPDTSVMAARRGRPRRGGRRRRARSATICSSPDHAHVQVGHERQRAAARALAAVEHDRAGLGDRRARSR